LGPENVPWIDALRVNTTLEVLNLRNNFIGDSGVRCLAEALPFNSTLKELYLDYNNKIGTEGARWLGDALRVNSTLKVLNLAYNFIGDAGAQWLADALRVNSGLEKLEIYSTLIESKGLQFLAEALKVNSTLRHFSVSGTYGRSDDEGVKQLAKALRVNSTLEFVGFPTTIHDDETIVEHIFERNFSLTHFRFRPQFGEIQMDNRISTYEKRNRNVQLALKKKLACGWALNHREGCKVGFDRMILRCVMYPMLSPILSELE
jgi:hypothetical protein